MLVFASSKTHAGRNNSAARRSRSVRSPTFSSPSTAATASRTAASSGRLYWESFNTPPMNPVAVPVGCSIFPKEIFRSSRRWAEKHFADKLVHWNELEKGGHFAAFEQPEIFVDEVRAALRHAR